MYPWLCSQGIIRLSDIALDVATKIVEPYNKIWSVFPGINRKFFSQFAQEGVIFLDTPGVALSAEVLANDDHLSRHVTMSRALVKYITGASAEPPSRNPARHPYTRSVSLSAAVGNVRNMFIAMRPGDLVLTSSGSFYDSILVGEVAGPYDPKLVVTHPKYGNELIPARRIKWIQIKRERRFLSEGLSRLLSNQKAVITIDKEVYGEEVYKFAYGDYVFNEESRYVYHGPKYKNIAPTTIPGIDLITYFSAAFNAAEIGEIDKFATMSINDAMQNYFEQDFLYSFEIDFASPGEYVLHAKRAALPLCVALLVYATSGTISFQEAQAADIVNSAHAEGTIPARQQAGQPGQADACMVEIIDKYKAIMNSLNADQYNKLCQMNKDAQDGVGLEVNVKKVAKQKQK